MSELTLLQDSLALLSGGAVGFSLGLVGGGGSVLAVPLLVYVVGVKDPHVAIGTSAFAVAVSAAVNLVTHFRSGNVKFRCAIAFAVFGILGAAIGSTVGKAIDGQSLLALFGVVMIAVGLSFARKPAEIGQPAVRLDRASARTLLPRIVPVALGVGFLAGFFGIGGGFLIVPGLVFSTGMPLLNAVGSSLLSVTTFGLTTAANYSLSGLVDWWIALLLIIGGAIGGIGGVAASKALAAKKPGLSYAFAAIVVIVGIYVVWRGVEALI
ncbi:MAG: sulfite exporter TauE/SafE family protein [Bauldia sp.]|uniref:sulfite exporter TauE/SafE family protein n=1 Tax=Bauldia sp. TaxID=2575872 RepID=UPI001D2B453A|nr:sulfite exporter TauE/SafE family protein [Bauldia sp.]MCB1495738.1 sulfite exporter TauE/SafE family protein [Bauldia sp.]